ncbi:glucose-1-phosphate adenylyltransferase, partial [bacterium]
VQHLPASITDHLAHGRPWDLDRTEGGLRVLSPHSGGEGPDGMADGNADALYRNIGLIRDFDPDVLVTLSADHVVRFDVRALVEAHRASGAAVTMGTKELPGEDVSRYAVLQVEEDRVTGFDYKPEHPEGHTVCTEAFAYDWPRLREFFDEHGDDDLKDYGHELLPHFVERDEARAFPIDSYWRDVGTIESYWQGHMDLLDPVDGHEGRDPLETSNPSGAVRTRAINAPPARIMPGARIENALISPRCWIAGEVVRSVLAPGVTVGKGAVVRDSVLMEGTTIRAGTRVERAIVDRRYVKDDVIGGEEIAVLGDEPEP